MGFARLNSAFFVVQCEAVNNGGAGVVHTE